MKLRLPAGNPGTEPRRDRRRSVFLQVLEGELWLRVEGKELTLTPTEFYVVPKNTPYRYRNSSSGETVIEVEFK